jgi:DNA-binding NarL/FixJ family response regulator
VLVVDDAPEIVGFVMDTLDNAGYSVVSATDGASALELVQQVTPDLVLMDAAMPGMHGFEACRRLKCHRQFAQLPLIFMTGLADAAHLEEGLSAGGIDYVTKPIVAAELLARIRVHLANARMASGTYAALDASGRFVFATDRAGRLLWCTPRAGELLPEVVGQPHGALPAVLIESLLRQRRAGVVPPRTLLETDGRKLEFSLLGSVGPNELLLRIDELHARNHTRVLQLALSLTAREADVLVWISRGKSNRDIGEILQISPRTVNKHLEQVYVKLGVENRAAAAARAVRLLAG